MKVNRVKDWSNYQHIKTRNAPWVKLYRVLLDDLEWHSLPAESAKILINCWLIGSENFGILPDLKKLAFRLRISEVEVKNQLLILSHWIVNEEVNISEIKKQVDNKTITRRYQADTNMYIEKEKDTLRERDTEREKRRTSTDKSYPQADGLKRPHQLFGWKLSKQDEQYLTVNRPDLNLDETITVFCDYWFEQPKSKGAPKNWSFQWRKWVRNSFVNDRISTSATVQINPDIAKTKARVAADDAIARTGPSMDTLQKIAKIKGQLLQ